MPGERFVPPNTDKSRVLLTEAWGGGHRFEAAEFNSQRLIRFIQPWGNFIGEEPQASEYEGMTPETIAIRHPSGRCDGYYTFTRISGILVVDNEPRGEHFFLEVQRSPITYLGGRVVNLRDLKYEIEWRGAAYRRIKEGFEKGVIFDCSDTRPYASRMYCLKPEDRVVPRPPESIRRY